MWLIHHLRCSIRKLLLLWQYMQAENIRQLLPRWLPGLLIWKILLQCSRISRFVPHLLLKLYQWKLTGPGMCRHFLPELHKQHHVHMHYHFVCFSDSILCLRKLRRLQE